MEPFDRLMHAADPALVVATTASAGRRAGCLVSFHGQSSMVPERYAVWFSLENHTYDVVRDATVVVVHFLARDQEPLARLFGGTSGRDRDKLAGLVWQPGPEGVPLLDEIPHRLVLRKVGFGLDGGDHACFVGEVLQASSPGVLDPLRFADLGAWAG